MPLVRTNPRRYPLKSGGGYGFRCDFKALTDCELQCRIVSGDGTRLVFEETRRLRAGETGSWPSYSRLQTPSAGYRAEYRMLGPGRVVLDDLLILDWSVRRPGFPDYFSPAFRAEWERFIRAAAERYRRNPAVNRVTVGGHGRWEEVMLDDEMPGLVDDQWLSRGFTQDRYLRLIEGGMDMYRGCGATRRFVSASPLA